MRRVLALVPALVVLAASAPAAASDAARWREPDCTPTFCTRPAPSGSTGAGFAAAALAAVVLGRRRRRAGRGPECA